jgi:CRP-like cAMP-binding protein
MERPDSLLNNIQKHIQLDSEEIEGVIPLFRFRRVPRKQLLLREGQVCKQLSFVHQGALRAYCMDEKGREATIMFALADWWITDMYCFVNGRKAMMYIEALEDSCVYQISKENWDRLLATRPKFEKLFRILMQNAYTREQLRAIESLSLSAEERYQSFLERYPQIVQQVTQKQIASYLGITPEFLSAIRKKRIS